MGRLTVYTESWSSRNRFLSMMLLIWGIIGFSCKLDECKDDNFVHPELWATSTFIIGFTAFGTLVMLSMNSFEKVFKLVLMVLWFIGGLLHLVAGGMLIDETNCEAGCGMYIFGGLHDGGVLWPTMISWVIAFDLHQRHLNDQRMRIIVYCTVVILNGIIFLCSLDEFWDSRRDRDGFRMQYVGMIMIVIGAGLIMIVVGLLQKTHISIFNFICAMLLFVGWFLMVCTNGICESPYVCGWTVLGAVVYLLSCEAQDGGTLKFMMEG